MHNKKIIEAVLFISGKNGLTINEISEKIKIKEEELVLIMDKIIADFIADDNTALMIKKFGNKYKLVTKKEVIELIGNNDVIYKNPLNSNLLEILAIIAYNVPCKRSTIFELRKKDPSEGIKKLIEMGFVCELGRSDAQGKPFIYGITDLFYDTFGVSSLDELPRIEVSNSSEEDGEIDFFDINRDDNE